MRAKRDHGFRQLKRKQDKKVAHAIRVGERIAKKKQIAKIPEMEIEELMRLAILQHNTTHCTSVTTENVTLRFLYKLCVNYLRHECTKYDDHIRDIEDETFSRTAEAVAIIKMRRKILRKIADAYPFLESECDSQIRQYVIQETYI